MLLPRIQASKLKAKAHSIQAKSVSAKVDALCAAIKGTDTGGGDSDCSEYMVMGYRNGDGDGYSCGDGDGDGFSYSRIRYLTIFSSNTQLFFT